MASKFWQTPSFKELQAEWEEKLRQSQFMDAEKLKENGERVLRQNAANCYRQAKRIARESKRLYYTLLGQRFFDEPFTDDVEALVMERRSHGIKIKQICEELKIRGERCHRETVRHIIRKYESKWGIKKT